MTSRENHRTRMQSGSTLKAYLQLFRIPNVFTAVADVTVGFLFVHPTLSPLPTFFSLLVASCLLYTAGMVLNDVYDLKVDARDRPHRPLPSGRISPAWAKWLGCWMLLIGVGLGWMAGYLYQDEALVPWRSGAVATVLAVSVVLYDRVLKTTPAGPLVMGACRTLNVLLGMSVAPALLGQQNWQWVGYHTAQLVAAGGIGLYIVGVTWFARTEARVSSRPQLGAATLVILSGILLVGTLPRWISAAEVTTSLVYMDRLRLLMAVLAWVIGWRCARGVLQPEPEYVQAAVKVCLMSLIVLDASMCLALRGPLYATAIIALVIPMAALGRCCYVT